MPSKVKIEAVKPFGNRVAGEVFSTFPWRAELFTKEGLATAPPGQAPGPGAKKGTFTAAAEIAAEATPEPEPFTEEPERAGDETE